MGIITKFSTIAWQNKSHMSILLKYYKQTPISPLKTNRDRRWELETRLRDQCYIMIVDLSREPKPPTVNSQINSNGSVIGNDWPKAMRRVSPSKDWPPSGFWVHSNGSVVGNDWPIAIGQSFPRTDHKVGSDWELKINWIFFKKNYISKWVFLKNCPLINELSLACLDIILKKIYS